MNLLNALARVSSLTLLSRIFGFIRDTIVARAFGASLYTDAFFVALKIPNLMRRLFAEGAFSQAFVPILAEYKNRRGEQETRLLIDHVTTWLVVALVVVTLAGMLAAPWVVWISAPGFADDPQRFHVTVHMLRITFPYILLISLVSLAGGILNTWNRFGIPAFTPVLFNLSLIGAALFLAPFCHPPAMALAWGVLLGGVAQLALQIPALKRIGLLPRLRFSRHDEGVWRILRQMGPAVFGVSISQLSLLINTIFASFLVTGSVSWLYYADRLMEFPTGILGVALGTILLPSLSRHHADNDTNQYSATLDWGLRLTLLLALPSAAALAVLSVPLVATLFEYGHFDAHDASMTRQALMAYSLGLLGLIMVKILAPGFYARQNIKTPVKIAILTLVSTQLMNLIFIRPLGVAGLALAIGLGACINAGVLLHRLRRQNIYQPHPGWPRFLAQTIFATAAMAWVLWQLNLKVPPWTEHPFYWRVLHLSGLIAAGLISYFVTLLLAGVRLRQFVRHTS